MLAKLALLRGLRREELAVLEHHARQVHLRRGEALVRRGERLPGFCALTAGALKLSVSGRSEWVVALVAAGETFGEAAVLRRRPSPFDAVAFADSEVAVIALGAVEKLARTAPRFARNLIDLLAERALALHAELEAGMLQNAAQRLTSYLSSLAGPREAAGPQRVHLPFSKTLLAAVLGMKKETLSRSLRELADRQVLEVSRRDITILDRRRLAELAG